MGARHRELGLDDERFVGRALDRLCSLLADRTFLTRAEIGEVTRDVRTSRRRGPGSDT